MNINLPVVLVVGLVLDAEELKSISNESFSFVEELTYNVSVIARSAGLGVPVGRIALIASVLGTPDAERAALKDLRDGSASGGSGHAEEGESSELHFELFDLELELD